MKRNIKLVLALLVMLAFAGVSVLENDAFARAGGSRSYGSSGSRSYSAPKRSTSSPATPSQPTSPSPMQQPAGGGFLRGMAGGIVGGLLGGMLFSSLGLAGTGGGLGGSGFGLIEILLLCGIGYIIYSMMKKRKEAALAYQGAGQQGSSMMYSGGSSLQTQPTEDFVTTGISHIRQMDSSFTESRFKDTAMDIFFKIQGAWTNRNLSSANMLLTDEMRGLFQQEIDHLLRDKKVNRLENIAVRNVEIVEAWQETGQDYIKAVFTANLLDYTTDDTTGSVIAGSKTDPVKFEECWTFTRPVGNNPWKLSAISQMEQ